MKKVAIVYASMHHGNTYKLVEAICKKYQNITMINASQVEHTDLSEYDMVGFVSGIDFGKFYEPVERFLEENLPNNKKVFFMYTCAKMSDKFTKSIKAKAENKGSIILGEYGCRGFNTYGPLKLIGGMNKHHPSLEEIDNAVYFYESLIK